MSSAPRLAILLSGRGSNFVALHDAIERGDLVADIVLVLSNRDEAPGIEEARRRGLETAVLPQRGLTRREHDARVVERLRLASVEWVCLAGYLRILSPAFVDAHPGRIVNIHPSLLPAFPGLDAQRQAWEHGVKVSGATVHLVDRGLDSGPIVAQAAVDLGHCTSADDAARRILAQEHRLYPAAMQRLLHEPWTLEGRRVAFDAGPKPTKKIAAKG